MGTWSRCRDGWESGYLGLPKSTVIALVQGEAPVLLDRLEYYKDPEYTGLFDNNPFYE